jgi:hypothetical protein
VRATALFFTAFEPVEPIGSSGWLSILGSLPNNGPILDKWRLSNCRIPVSPEARKPRDNESAENIEIHLVLADRLVNA